MKATIFSRNAADSEIAENILNPHSDQVNTASDDTSFHTTADISDGKNDAFDAIEKETRAYGGRFLLAKTDDAVNVHLTCLNKHLDTAKNLLEDFTIASGITVNLCQTRVSATIGKSDLPTLESVLVSANSHIKNQSGEEGNAIELRCE